jgi:hypothetical protein
MEETANPGYAELNALKAANDALREEGKRWLFETLERLAAELSPAPAEAGGPTNQPPSQPMLQVGRQEWQFEVERQKMVGERLGVRWRERTLVVEVGWPRLPEHGFVPDQGLARGRVGFSQNVMLEPLLIDEITLRRQRGGAPVWHVIANQKLGEPVTEAKLRDYLRRLFSQD